MAEEKARSEWDHTALILAMLNNTHSKKHRKPDDFHPFKSVRWNERGKKGEFSRSGVPLHRLKAICHNVKGK